LAAKEYDIGDDADYLHVCAQLKAREFEFLEKSKLDRMAHSADLDGFIKILSETYYSKYISLITAESNLDELVMKSNREIVDYLSHRLKQEHLCVLDLLMFEENIHNYKTLIKALVLKENLSGIFLPSLFSYETLMDEITGQGYVKLDKNTLDLLGLALSLKDKMAADPRQAEIEFEKVYMNNLYLCMENTDSGMLIDFTKHLIDINNIKNISRIKYADLKIDYGQFLIENGFLTTQYLKKFENENADFLVQELSGSEYSDIVIRGNRSLYNYDTFFSFDKNEYIFYLRFFEKIKYTVANIEKIFSFFMKKKIELKILNIIYLGILYGIEKAKIEHKVEIIGGD